MPFEYELSRSKCWSCGKAGSAALREEGTSIVYIRLCRACLHDLSSVIQAVLSLPVPAKE